MATPIRQDEHTAKKSRNCYLCGHLINPGTVYLAATFKPNYRDRWRRLRFTSICKVCRPAQFCECGECDYAIDAEPAEPMMIVFSVTPAGVPF